MDTQWLEEQIKLRKKQPENLPSRALEEVQESMGERHPTETNVAVATAGELVVEPEMREDTDVEEEQEEEREASIGEMLDVMGEDSPHIQMPKRRRLADVEGARRVSVMREEETMVVEAELSTS